MNHYTIALSGLYDTDAAMFEAALGSLPANAWKLVGAPPANLLVVDVDTVWGHMDWLRAISNGQQVVAYTNDENPRNSDLVLHKPLRTRDLATLLESITHSAGQPEAAGTPFPAAPQTSTGTATDPVPPVEPEATTDQKNAYPTMTTPEAVTASESPSVPTDLPLPDMTLGECLLTETLGYAISIKNGGVTLQLDPERGGYNGSPTLKPLKPLLAMPFKAAQTLSANALAQMRQTAAIPLTRLLWFAALCATPGKLSPGLDAGATYHLTRWPQIEREFPRHFRIATAMMKGPGTLGDIASTANAPVTDVADFINAYSIAGHVACSDSPAAGEDAGNGDKRVLSRLRRSFSRTPP